MAYFGTDAMPILIDGYNLLHATGIAGGSGPHALALARAKLLTLVGNAVPAQERSQTTVVWDARNAPPGLPKSLDFQGIRVLFAERGEEADDLLERLIREHHTPRRLVVVSSDHRVQRAAKRRRAQAIDSDVWLTSLARNTHRVDFPAPEEKTLHLPADEWIKLFQIKDESGSSAAHSDSTSSPYGPFPDGYGEDLVDDA